MKPEDRDRRTLARRIVKAIEPLLEDATRKEAELNGRPYAQQIREMDEALLSRRGSLAESVDIPVIQPDESKHEVGIASPEDADIEMVDAPNGIEEKTTPADALNDSQEAVEKSNHFQPDSLRTETILLAANTPPASTNGFRHDPHTNGDVSLGQEQQVEPPTPPMSLEGQSQNPPVEGGIPWYVAQFDPEGITIFDERWTGPEVLREMSEELSEMDEDELEGLGPEEEDVLEQPGDSAILNDTHPTAVTALVGKKITRRASRRSKGGEWGTRSFRTRR